MELILYQGTNLILLLIGTYFMALVAYSYFMKQIGDIGWEIFASYAVITIICFAFVALNQTLSHPVYIFESRCIWFNELLVVPTYLMFLFFTAKPEVRDPNVLASFVILFILLFSASAYLMFGYN